MKINRPCLKLYFLYFFCVVFILSIFIIDKEIYATDTSLKNNAPITKQDEMIIKYVEKQIEYFLSTDNKNELKKRIEEFCTDSLADNKYYLYAGYLGKETGFSTYKIGHINFSQKGNDLEVLVKYDEFTEEETIRHRKAIYNLKSTKKGWRIYKERFLHNKKES